MSLATKKCRAGKTPLALALCLVVLGCRLNGPDALLKGDRLIRQGKFPAATKVLRTATERLGDGAGSAQAWNLLGLALHQTGNFSEAVKAYQQAIAHDRNFAVPRFNLGCLQLELNNAPAAAELLAVYCVLQPNDAKGWAKLGIAQLQAQRSADAERSFVQALKLSPRQPDALNGLGMLQVQKRRAREAAQYFATALAAQPGHPAALLNLALVSHLQLNQRPLALQKYREYLALKPAPPRTREVAVLAKQLADELNPPPVAVAPSTIPAPLASTPSVPSTKPALPATNPSTGPTRLLSTNLLAAVPTNRPAATNITAAISLPARTNVLVPPASTNLVLGSSLSKTGATQTVRTAAVPVEVVSIAVDPEVKPAQDPVPPPSKAPVSIPTPVTTTAPAPEPTNRNATASAETDPTTARRPEKEKPSILDRMNPAKWFQSKSRNSRSREPAPTPLTSPAINFRTNAAPVPEPSPSPPPPAPAPVFARYSYRPIRAPAAGNRTEAEKHFAVGLAAHKQRRWTQALNAYETAITQDPAFFEAQFNLGLAAYEMGDWSRALQAYETALALSPASAAARYNFALALEKANYPVDAAEEMEKVLRAEPNDNRVRLSLATLYAQVLLQKDAARRNYLELLQKDPRHPQGFAIRNWLAANP